MPPLALPRRALKQSLDNVFNPKPNDVSPEFRNAIEKAWQELPETDKNALQKAGVKIYTVRNLRNKEGSDGLYDPSSKTLSVGEFGGTANTTYKLFYQNADPGGTFKHEIGHAIFQLLRSDQLNQIQSF